MPLELVPMFSGELAGAESADVTPSTFIKKFRAHMRDLRGPAVQADAQKIEAFPDYLVEDSPAESWFVALQAGPSAVTTWQALEAAFHVHFPGPVKAERTAQEWERELVGMKITLAELGTTVKVGGVDVFAHVHFASCLLEIARLAGIATTVSGIWQLRDALPEVLREKVLATQVDWGTYTAAIKAIDRVHIREGVAKARQVQEMECTIADLSSTRTPPLTLVSRMAAQLSRTALATPCAALVPAQQVPANANPFGGGGGQGNLFALPTMTEEGKVHLRKIVKDLSGAMLSDDTAGRAAYARRITNWNGIHGGQKRLLEHTGYPLSPGTAPPCSGECYGCGKVTAPWHCRSECPGPVIPAKESTFRSLCAKYLREAPTAAVNAVLDDLAWMDFAPAEEEDFGEGLSE
ncbi:hypothetical protein C8R45DRAFT_1085032 [Mycena sanguinolenta]|nr:hypothetical protein C8R45DRAFT_1085032 [Mycena sanguinolenta]